MRPADLTLATWQRAVDIVAAALFGLVALPAQLWISDQASVWTPAVVLGVVLLVGALALRRMAPGLALAVAWGAAVVQMASLQTPYLVDLAILGVLYTTAAYGSRRTFWAGLASAIGGAVVAGAYLFLGPFGLQENNTPWTPVSIGVVIFGVLLFALTLAWTVGALVRTARRARANRFAQERAEADAIAEQHRARIARDMHDVVAHSLAVVIAQADGARYAAAGDPEATARALGTISATARAALGDVRLILTQLRHREEDGPQPTLADLDALFAQVRDAGATIEVDIDPAPGSPPPGAVQLAVYRIVQEALTNAMRHGDGPVAVQLAWHPERVDLSVRNHIDTAPGHPGTGHGIIGMRERAHLVGGTLTAGPDGDVFVVRARIPLDPGDAVPAPGADDEGGHA